MPPDPDNVDVYADETEGEDDEHQVPADLLELYEVLEWEQAVAAAEGEGQ